MQSYRGPREGMRLMFGRLMFGETRAALGSVPPARRIKASDDRKSASIDRLEVGVRRAFVLG